MPVQVINGVGIAGIGTGSSSQSGGGSSPSFDTDVQAFITAASITATTQQNAVNDLVLDLKAANLWTKMKALYPMVGGTSSSHKWNLKDPRDLDAAFRLNFVGGWTHSSTGALPNGTDGYANTFLSTYNISLNSGHMSFYSRTNNTTSGIDMGTLKSSPDSYSDLVLYNSSLVYTRFNNTVPYNNVTANGTLGFYVGSRTANNVIKGYKNNITIINGTASSNSTSSVPFFIGASNIQGTAQYYANRQCAFASIGDGLTDLESNLLYQIVEKFQYTLGRNVNESKSFYFNRNYSLEANAFIFNGGITGSTEMSATNTLVSDLKAAGLWDKMQAIYPMVGGTSSSHKWNLKDPRDLDAAYRLVFNGGWTHSSTGALPNGTTGYADTFLKPSTALSLNSTHISYYSRTSVTGGPDMGASVTNAKIYLYIKETTLSAIRINTDGPGTESLLSNDDGRGFYIGNRIISNKQTLFKNNTKNDFTVNSLGRPNVNIWLGALNNPIPYYGNKQCAFASIGDGLTDLESSLFYQIVEKFQYTLGRNINATQPFYYSSGYTNETNAFVFNGGITDATQISATNTLVSTLKTTGIWSKMKAVYPMVGGTATSHKFNLVNPVDTTSAYALTFNGGWTHTASGATPNGTTGYANTGLAPGIIGMSSSSLHLSYYSRTTSVNGTSRVYIGSANGDNANNNVTILAFGNSGTAEIGSIAGSLDGAGYSPTTTLTNYIGLKFITVNGNRNARYYKNGVFIPNQVVQTGNLDQYPLYLSAINRYNTIVNSFNNQQCAFASIGDGLTDVEATTFYNAVQAFQTTLGRQV